MEKIESKKYEIVLKLSFTVDSHSNKIASIEIASNEIASNEIACNEIASNETASNEFLSKDYQFSYFFIIHSLLVLYRCKELSFLKDKFNCPLSTLE